MANLTKTVQTVLKAITNVSANSWSFSDVYACTNTLAAAICIDVAPEATNTNRSQFIVETSQVDSGSDLWTPIRTFVTDNSTLGATTLNGALSAGASSVTITSATNWGRNDFFFIKDGTLANSEWGRCRNGGSTTFTPEDNILNAHNNGVSIYSKAQRFWVPLDLGNIKRLRVAFNNDVNASSVAVNWRCALLTTDSIG